MFLFVLCQRHTCPLFKGSAEGVDLAVTNQGGNLLGRQAHLQVGEGHGLLNGLQFLLEAGVFSRQIALEGPNAKAQTMGNVLHHKEAAWYGCIEFLLDKARKALLSDLLGQVLVKLRFQILPHDIVLGQERFLQVSLVKDQAINVAFLHRQTKLRYRFSIIIKRMRN